MHNIFESIDYKINSGKESGTVLPVCYLCDEVPELGMWDGFYLKGIFICSCCEQKLVKSNPADEPNYKENVNRLKNILFKKDS